MNPLLQIGSVFQIKSIQFLVVGYCIQEVDQKVTYGYKCVGLPYGYIKTSDIRLIEADRASDIIYDAKCDLNNNYIEHQLAYFQNVQELGMENTIEVLKELNTVIEKELKNDE